MSRGYEGRDVAWRVWVRFYTAPNELAEAGRPVAYEHQCGALGRLPEDDYGSISCPGCHYEIARPEVECTPLYGRKEGT